MAKCCFFVLLAVFEESTVPRMGGSCRILDRDLTRSEGAVSSHATFVRWGMDQLFLLISGLFLGQNGSSIVGFVHSSQVHAMWHAPAQTKGLLSALLYGQFALTKCLCQAQAVLIVHHVTRPSKQQRHVVRQCNPSRFGSAQRLTTW